MTPRDHYLFSSSNSFFKDGVVVAKVCMLFLGGVNPIFVALGGGESPISLDPETV